MAKIKQDVDFDTTPQSRVEDIIKATVDGEEYDKPAESRVEYWLIELKNAIEGGGGGGDTSAFATSLRMTIDSSTFVVTAQLYNEDGDALGTAQTVDLPLESVVVGGSYNDQTKKVVLTLQNGNTVEFSVADLVAGLQEEITAQNKLSADLVDDTNATHKFVTTAEKATWNGKQDALTFDNFPVSGSNNPVKSGGLYAVLVDKVDVVPGKGLSTNDYTTAEKTKLGKAITTDEITVESNYFVLNGVRVYVSATMPTGNIPDGSVWIPGGAI